MWKLALLVLTLSSTLTVLVLAFPTPAGACTPCSERQSGERWLLEVDSWTVDDAPQALMDLPAGLSVSNPYYRDGSPAGPTAPEEFLTAEFLDPASSDQVREVRMIQVRQ